MSLARSNSLSFSPVSSSGQIQLILGPMFSGKTTELLRRVQRYKIAQGRCLLVKHSRDNRYDEANVITHDKRTLTGQGIDEVKTNSLKSLADEICISDYDCIGVDEGQFFPNLTEFCEQAANNGSVVVVAALDGTFQRKPFGQVLELIPLAEDVCKLTSVCMSCYREQAAFSFRICGDQQVELVGGPEAYKALCRGCYKQHATKQSNEFNDMNQIDNKLIAN